MYFIVLRLLSAACLLFTFWPTLRFHNVTWFDWLAPMTMLCALPYTPQSRGPAFADFALAAWGIALLTLGGIVSFWPSFDSHEHLLRVAKLVIALAGSMGFAFAISNRKLLSVDEALVLLCFSAAASSAVCILQGQFHLLTGLMPAVSLPTGVEAWTRFTGLAEHPIETGIVADFGIVIALGLAMRMGRWPLFIAAVGLDLYSAQYSASLTAVFGGAAAVVGLCLAARRYRSLASGALLATAAAAVALTSHAGLLHARLAALSRNQGNFETLRSREMQWTKSLGMIEPSTLLVGNGYSTLDLPYGLEIHNGLLAAVFHFGLLGALSQVLLIGFFLAPLRGQAPRELKAVLLGCVIVFAFSYMTGPALLRRSLWLPPLILSAYLTQRGADKLSQRTRVLAEGNATRSTALSRHLRGHT